MLWFLACQGPPAPGAEVAAEVVINEIVARNQSTWDDGSVTFPDWVELYNAGERAVDLAELTLSDGAGVWRPAGEGQPSSLRPGERVLVPLGAAAGFRLSAGETLTLHDATGVLDRVTLGDLAADVAWARLPDGGAWGATVEATPGRPNPAAPSDTLDPSERAFGVGTLHSVDLALPPDAVASLERDRLAWVEGAVTLDGVRYAPVAVRLKSTHGSMRTLDEKPGWKIDLNAYADLSWRGQKGLTLNNLVQDPTYLREDVAYALFRAVGVPAPRVGWTRVTLNGADYGLSLLVENADDRFLARWYADPSGALYEGTHGVDLVPGREPAFEYDEGPDPADRSDLTAVIAALGAPPDDAGIARLEELVNLDEVLTHLAAEALTLHWDGYRNTNNYRLYHDPASGRFDMLPWGTDNTFDRGKIDPWMGDGVLFQYCLANPGCRARYDAKLVEVADVLDASALGAEVERVDAWLAPAIAADPKREFELPLHDVEVEEVRHLLGWWPGEVRARVGGP